MPSNPAVTSAKIVNARKFVEQRQSETMKILRKSVGAVPEPTLHNGDMQRDRPASSEKDARTSLMLVYS